MASTIQIKRNTATGQTPQSLVSGELAVNVFDRKLYVGNNASGVTGLLGEDFKITTQASAGSIAHLKLFNVPYGNTRGTVSNTIALVGDDAITVARAANGAITFALDNDFGQSFPTDSGTATPTNHALAIAGGNGINTSGTGATVTVTLAPTITSSHTFDNDIVFNGAAAGANDLVWDKSANALEFADNNKATFGTGADLAIYHDGSNSYIDDASGTGSLIVKTNQFTVRNAAGDENLIAGTADGAVQISHNNSTKIATTSTGVTITGVTVDDGATHAGDVTFVGATSGRDAVWDTSDNAFEFADNARAKFGTGGDLEILHDSNNSSINHLAGGQGDFYIQSDQFYFRTATEGENYITATRNGAVTLSNDGAQKLSTLSTGVSITGNLVPASADGGALGGASNEWSDLYLADGSIMYFGNEQDVTLTHIPDNGLRMADNRALYFGNDTDLQLYHDGSNSYINDAGTGSLIVKTSQWLVRNAAGSENMIAATQAGAVELYYANSAKLATKTDGVDITGELQSDTLDVDGNADISGTLTVGTNLTVAGNHHIDGNLTVEGATTYVSSSTVKVDDSMLILAANNAAHTVDAGVYQKYVNSGTKFAGYFFDATDNVFKFFKDTSVEPTTTVNLAGSGYAMAQLDAVIDGGTF